MRIAKFIAAHGLCSRREAERWIENKRVEVNNNIITSPALNITDQDLVKIDGEIISSIPEPRLWVYYKPTGLVTTHKDTEGRATVFEQVHSLIKDASRVISVGRLDLNSEGILLLTNNGEVARFFERPENNIERIYKVRAFSRSKQQKPLNFSNKQIVIDGINYKPKSIKLIKTNVENSNDTAKKGANNWYEVILTEGKNREIRKIFEHFGFEVNRLIRTSYGQYKLGKMQPGEVKEVKLRHR